MDSSKAKKAVKAAKLQKDKMACNKPKRTSGHKTKSHVVKACDNGKEKIIRFGQQGVKVQVKIQKLQKIKLEKNLIMQDIMLRILVLTKCQLDIGHTRLNGK